MKVELDRIAAILSGLTILLVVAYLLIRNQPLASPQLFFALRVLLSLLAALLGATIPGFLDLKWSGSGFAIRAGGALALFVLTYVFTPRLEFKEKSGGNTIGRDQSGIIVGRDNINSPITFNPTPHSQACRVPAHGVESYQRSLTKVMTSPEMGGGHNQTEWCTSAQGTLAGDFPGGKFTVLDHGESSRNHCWPSNCPQYTYTCTFQIEADPLYKSAVGPECP